MFLLVIFSQLTALNRYIDDYVSLNPNGPAFMGNRSLVIHLYNGTRFACANWVAISYAMNVTTATTTASSIAGSAHTSLTAATSYPATPSGATNSTKSGAEAGHTTILVVGMIPVLAALAFAVA